MSKFRRRQMLAAAVSDGGGGGVFPIYSFGGVEICPAPLYYGASGFKVKDSDWNHDSYGSAYGKTNGSYIFSFLDLGSFFDSRGPSFGVSSGDIDNANSVKFDGRQWRVPTKTEMETIFTTSPAVRVGSTVNGSVNKHYARIRLTGVTHAGSSTPTGFLIFPDGGVINGKQISTLDVWYDLTDGFTESDLNNYLSQGCAFIPASGECTSGSFRNGGEAVFWLTATSANENECHAFSIERMNTLWKFNEYKYAPVRLVRTI